MQRNELKQIEPNRTESKTMNAVTTLMSFVFPGNACVTGSGGLQTAGRGATRLAIERHLDAQRHKGRDFVASGGLETAPPSYRMRQFKRSIFLISL